MATIEIRTKDVKDTAWMFDQGSPQHTYIIYTDDNGNQEILRGGLIEKGKENRLNTDNIQNGDLIVYRDYYSKFSVDWREANDPSVHSSRIANGSDSDLSQIWSSMISEGQRINNQGYDYELLTQNCNTALAYMVKAGQIKAEELNAVESTEWKGLDLPDDNGNEWWTPAVNKEFNNSFIDNFFDFIYNKSETVEYIMGNTYEVNSTAFNWITGKFNSLESSFGYGSSWEDTVINNLTNNFDFSLSSKITNSTNYLGNALNHASPLAFDLDGDGIETTHLYDDTNVFFDIDNDDFAERVGWIAADDGQLALDRDGNGNIDNITELFGDYRMSAWDELGLLDTNENGKIDVGDEQFSDLVIWQDLNQNGISEDGELKVLSEYDIQQINLNYTTLDEYQKENYISGKSSVVYNNGNIGNIVYDVHFMNDNVNTWYKGSQSEQFGNNFEINLESILMPLSRGYGSTPSLHIALSKDSDLMDMMREFVNLKGEELSLAPEKLENILYQWAGVQNVDPDSMKSTDGSNIDARKVAFVEQFTGVEWEQLGTRDVVGHFASLDLKKAWDGVFNEFMSRFLIQGNFSNIFSEATYDFVSDSIKINTDYATIISRIEATGENNINFLTQLAHVLYNNKEALEINISQINTDLSAISGEDNLFLTDENIQIDSGTQAYYDDMESGSIESHDDSNILKKVGTEGDDVISTSNLNEYVFGKGGNDTITGHDGGDYLDGGAGNDILTGGDDKDWLIGQEGDDTLYGNDGRDKLMGGAGNDTLYGGAGDDRVEGFSGADYLDGGEGVDEVTYIDSSQGVNINLETGEFSGGDAEGDTIVNVENIHGSTKDDNITGDAADNLIHGEGGDDILHGGAGNDTIFGAQGSNEIYAEAGDDVLRGFNGNDIMDGGEGVDEVYYDQRFEGYVDSRMNINLVEGKAIFIDSLGSPFDTLINIENVIGSYYDDTIIGNSADNKLEGRGGDDIIFGGNGDDILIGWEGNNELTGGDGDDEFWIINNKNNIDTIIDFDTQNDSLNFAAFTSDIVKGYSDISISQVGDDSSIDLGDGQTLILKNTDAVDLKREHFYGLNENPESSSGIKDLNMYINDSASFNVSTFAQISDPDGDPVSYEFTMEDGSPLPEWFIFDSNTNQFSVNTPDIPSEMNLKMIAKDSYSGESSGVFHVSVKSGEEKTGDEENNFINGTTGDDTIRGMEGDDQIFGQIGSDIIYGGEGDDYIQGDASGIKNEYMNTVSIVEKDTNNGTDIIYGGSGNDTIFGNKESDELYGDDGDDVINGGEGDNLLSGGIGGDKFIITNNPGCVDTIIDFDINNSKEYLDFTPFQSEDIQDFNEIPMSQMGADVLIELGLGQQIILKNINISDLTENHFKGFENQAPEIISSMENVRSYISSSFSFYLSQVITASDPNNDELNYEVTLEDGSPLPEWLIFNSETLQFNGTAPDNESQIVLKAKVIDEHGAYITQTFNFKVVNGGEFIGNDGAQIISSSLGADIIKGMGGGDFLFGSEGDDAIYGGDGNDYIFGDGQGVYNSSTGEINFVYDEAANTDGNDEIYGENGDDQLYGLNGNDIIDGGAGRDIITAGGGNDIIYDGAGKDVISAGAGNDIIHLQDGNRLFNFDGVETNTYFAGEGGDDTFVIHKDNSPEVGTGDINNFIYDFELDNTNEKIDLSNFRNIQSVDDLVFSNSIFINSGITSFLKVYLGGSTESQFFTLFNIEGSQLTNDNFIFFENNAPEAVDDNFSTTEDNSLVIFISNMLINDIDTEDGTPIFSKIVSYTTNGTLSDNEDGTFSYIPNDNFYGNDSFVYEIKDSIGVTKIATVNIEVKSVNDTPTATITTATINEDSSVEIDVLSGASDIEGDELTINSVTNGVNGTSEIIEGRVVYTPNANFNGIDTITYTITDSNGGEITKTLNITIDAVEDVPIATVTTAITNEENFIKIDVLKGAFDADGDELTLDLVTNGENGTSEIIEGKILYTPNENFNGTDTITYTISDSNSNAVTKELTINVNAVNDVPIANNDSTSTSEDNQVIINILSNDFDVEDVLAKENITLEQPLNGSVILNDNATITYTPNENFNGTDTFIYSVEDSSGAIRTATVTVNVDSINDNPTATITTTATTDEDNSVIIDILNGATDVDGDELIIESVTNGEHGITEVGNGEIIVYTPNENFNGTDTITYTISDGRGGVVTKEFTININSVNDAPTATDKTTTTRENKPVEIDVLTGTSDIDGDDLSLDSVTNGTNGTASIVDGKVIYTPNQHFFGTDILTYTVSDGNGGLTTQNVTVNVDKGRIVDGTSDNDTILGGFNNDIINGGEGNDRVYGKVGDDEVYGGGGNDLLVGNDGNDTLNGGAGIDRLLGGNDNDTLSGGSENDTLYGQNGDDILNGDEGNDFINGGSGIDTLNGGLGEDSLYGEDGNDTLFGNEDNDLLVGNDGNDTLNGGAGIDRLLGGNDNDTLSGGSENDTLYGQNGDDILNGDEGNDFINGGSGIDTLNGGLGEDSLYGEDGNDTLFGNEDNDTLYGNNHNDTLYGNEGDDYLNGGSGNDILNGGIGEDMLTGDVGEDIFKFDTLEDSEINKSDLNLKYNDLDIISDFLQGQDLIDLSGIAMFNNIQYGDDLDSGLSYHYKNSHTIIEDHNSDFAIKLIGEVELTNSDFIFE